MTSPICFANVSYARNEFVGDLVITSGVIYYFPQINVAAHKAEFALARTLGGIGFEILLRIAASAATYVGRSVNKTEDPSNLQELGLWTDSNSNTDLQARLDAFVSAVRNQRTDSYGLPRPLRFASNEIKNLSVKHGKFAFDSECDHHDFNIGFRNQKSLRIVLWESGTFRSSSTLGSGLR